MSGEELEEGKMIKINYEKWFVFLKEGMFNDIIGFVNREKVGVIIIGRLGI